MYLTLSERKIIMEIYDLYADPFNLGDIRNSLKEGEVIEDPSSGNKYKVIDVDNIEECIVIERMSTSDHYISFKEFLEETRIYMDQEYMVQYCEWDERWYAWGTEFNINLSDETKKGAIEKFESLVSFFVYNFCDYDENGILILPDS